MTTQDKLIKRKLSLLELAEFLQNISQARKIIGCSLQHFYDIKKSYEEIGLEGLREKAGGNPVLKTGSLKRQRKRCSRWPMSILPMAS